MGRGGRGWDSTTSNRKSKMSDSFQSVSGLALKHLKSTHLHCLTVYSPRHTFVGFVDLHECSQAFRVHSDAHETAVDREPAQYPPREARGPETQTTNGITIYYESGSHKQQLQALLDDFADILTVFLPMGGAPRRLARAHIGARNFSQLPLWDSTIAE
ncbi:hypothetical protein N7516_006210 [Penicillium verrucosum]|uniref:uncharacterized protein n=1 Tax=Penicillium verrucosum TaxID=60171 RepID=UPI0025452D4F|nr:uncharacterized protein N7516_006210 [Penicillium verrucosum]KAJ5931721.1 hypothetical protein N7516_006210 [Penicillium verrucosum]